MNLIPYQITGEPAGAEYEALLKFSARRAKCGLLVRRATITLKAPGERVLTRLRPYLLSQSDEASWPGTKLWFGHTAEVFRFAPLGPAIQILLEAASHLFAWKQPELPEDLCFERGGGAPLLVSISHEKHAQLYLTDDEASDIRASIPNLPLTRIDA